MITAMDIKDGLIVTGSHDNALKVWDIERKKGISFDNKRGHINQVTQAMVWDEQSVLSASADRTVRYFDIKEAESNEDYQGVVMRGHAAGVTQLKRLNNSFSRAVSAGMDGTVRIWDVLSGICTGEFGDHEGVTVSRVAMNRNFLVSYSDHNNLMIVRDFEKGA